MVFGLARTLVFPASHRKWDPSSAGLGVYLRCPFEMRFYHSTEVYSVAGLLDMGRHRTGRAVSLELVARKSLGRPLRYEATTTCKAQLPTWPTDVRGHRRGNAMHVFASCID